MKITLFTVISILMIIFSLQAIEFPVIQGWKPINKVKTYNQENLYEYIDGAADKYLAYGFKLLLTRQLSKQDLTIIVDIYDMGTPLNAFGIYKAERPRDQKTFAIGTEAVITPPYQCLLLNNSCYVKINILKGELTVESGISLLTRIAEALPGSTGYPAALKLLPIADKIQGSEDFVRENFLGMSDLANCIVAKYKHADGEFRYFVLLPSENKTTATTWNALAQNWKKMEINQLSVLYSSVPSIGVIGIILTQDKIIGVTDCENEAEMIERLEKVLK